MRLSISMQENSIKSCRYLTEPKVFSFEWMKKVSVPLVIIALANINYIMNRKKRCSIAQKHKFSSNYELPWMKSNCQRCKMACIWLAVIWFMLLSDFVWVLVEEYGLLHAIIMYSSWVKHMRITFLLWNNAWKCKLCNQLFCQWLCQCFGNIHQKKTETITQMNAERKSGSANCMVCHRAVQRLRKTYFKHKIYMLIAWIRGMYIFVFVYALYSVTSKHTHAKCIAIYACMLCLHVLFCEWDQISMRLKFIHANFLIRIDVIISDQVYVNTYI